MSKQEFLEQLRKNISSINDYEVVNDTMNYYEEYIENEIRRGKEEQTVLDSLGDPRLIAKSIVATHEFDKEEQKETNNSGYRTSETVFNGEGKTYRLPTWLFKLLGILVIGVVLVIAFIILQSIFPILVVGIILYMFYKFVRNNLM